MVIPTWIFCGRPGGSIFLAWAFLTAYVNLSGLFYLVRFLRGKWRSMRVIEHAPPLAHAPTGE
jgi:MATE family multidrug resistance protein